MDSADIPRVAYLVILLTAVVGWVMAENRNSLGKSVRSLLVWGMIIIGLMAGYGLWGDIRNDHFSQQAVLSDGSGIEVPRAPDGHFHLTLGLNGVPVEFLVDTGASDVVLSRSDAARVGINLNELAFLGRANTANGIVKTAHTTVDRASLGPYQFDGLRVAVNDGDMDRSLLGMSFLSRFERLEISGNRMVLEP